MKKITTLLIFIISLKLSAQITGRVTDTNNEGLPVVNVYTENELTGTTTNDDGLYILDIKKPGTYTIVFQYLGFQTWKKKVDIKKFPFELNAVLKEESISLNEVTINSKENPAIPIMKSMIKHRKENLDKISEFSADFYSKGLLKIKDAPKKFLGQKVETGNAVLDSTRSGIIYLSETISKIDHKRPDKFKETIVASKTSGDDNGISFNQASEVDFNIYENTIDMGKPIISPIASNAMANYRYKLEGSFYDDHGFMIYKIKVIPRRENNPVFSGYIYVVDEQWTVYGTDLKVSGKQMQQPVIKELHIKQTFNYQNQDEIWVVISQTLDFEAGIFGFNFNGRFSAAYSNYNFNPNFTKKTFGREILSFEEGATKKDSTFWENQRKVPLTLEETKDYKVRDSIVAREKTPEYLDSIDRAYNKWEWGNLFSGYSYRNSKKDYRISFDMPWTEFRFNTVQGWNSNVNLDFSKYNEDKGSSFYASATVEYGFSDDRVRPSGYVYYRFNQKTRPAISVRGGNRVKQFNRSEPITPFLNTVSSLFFQDNYMKVYEEDFASIRYSQKIFNGVLFYANLGYYDRSPLYNTTDQTFFPKSNRAYTSNNPFDGQSLNAPFIANSIYKTSIGFQFRFGEKYMSYPNFKISIPSSKYPTLLVQYGKAFGASNSDYNYDKIVGNIRQSFNIGNKGNFRYNISAGKFFNAENISAVDFQYFNGNELNFSTASRYTNVFNLLPYYKIYSKSEYSTMHAEHNFNSFIMGKIPLLNKLNYNLVIGGHALFTKENKPYTEFTVGLDNVGFGKFRLFRVDYIKSYFGNEQKDGFVIGAKIGF
ncbi:DUF5686 and carboxypeptidase regulatory-like domain-containing protein [Aureivirga sp. CE67]|uniref:DUF5686 and carboxypeptidase regulatory-like domain-containing protein n=1 Tax=Aureivirga sp. CE67 TaxID=1788983 RepID=UPI0018CA8AC9|nr:DUF5686 and carboxypeptidase regulatory-like domain-containing protein [Aureivirga sp. CE67]